MLVWHDSELCIAWPRSRASLGCHSKTQFLMRITQLRSTKKLVMLGSALQCVCAHYSFPCITGFQTDPDDIFAMHKMVTRLQNAEERMLECEEVDILCKSIVLVLQSCITSLFPKVNPHYKFIFHAEEICNAFIRVRYLCSS